MCASSNLGMSASGRFPPVATLLSDRQLLGESCRSKNRSNVPLMAVHELPLLARKLTLRKPLEREQMNQRFFTLTLRAGLLPECVRRCCDTS